jgi:hypothetical protein
VFAVLKSNASPGAETRKVKVGKLMHTQEIEHKEEEEESC